MLKSGLQKMPSLAPSATVLRKRVRRLLGLDAGKSSKGEISKKIFPILKSLGEVALIGGAIRDLARVGRRGFNSDLDFVIYESSKLEFRSCMRKLEAKPNKFGGYSLQFQEWKVDVWHIEDTWARTEGLRKVEVLSDLLHCTFFDWDSVLFDVGSGELILDEHYLEKLQRGIMNIQLELNPNVAGSFVRAIRRAAIWKVHFGPELSAFSLNVISQFNWNELVELDKRAFTEAVLLFLDRDLLIDRLHDVEMLCNVETTLPVPDFERQPSLQFSWEDKGRLPACE